MDDVFYEAIGQMAKDGRVLQRARVALVNGVSEVDVGITLGRYVKGRISFENTMQELRKLEFLC